MELTELYRATIAKWGEEAQYDQMMEECAEVITVLMHYRRNKADRDAVIHELADLTLMLGQLTWMFGADEVQQAVAVKRAKLDRLLAQE